MAEDIKVTIHIPRQRLKDAITSGVSGIRYWATDVQVVSADYMRLIFTESDTGQEHAITESAWSKAVATLAERYPAYFDALMSPLKCDQTTGDALIQCAVFGELKYG